MAKQTRSPYETDGLLDERQVGFVTYIEQYYLLYQRLPSFELVRLNTGITQNVYDGYWASQTVRNALLDRGIALRVPASDGRTSDALDAQQLLAINVLLDFNDTRPDHKKLTDLGITTRTYQAWRKDPAFQDYLRQRAESMLDNSLDEIHRAVLDSARSGDMQAIKIIYDKLGYYRSNDDNSVDIRSILIQIVEIMQKHLSDDPAKLQSISLDILKLR